MAIEVAFPQLGESVVEGTITKWLVKEGDFVHKEQPIVEVATDKADNEIPAPTSGVITKIVAAAGATVRVQGVLCVIDANATASQSALPQASPVASISHETSKADANVARSAFGGALASPETRQVARNLGLDASQIVGSGDHGRVTREDVLRSAQKNGHHQEHVVAALPSNALSVSSLPQPVSDAPEIQALMQAALNTGKQVYVPPIPNVGFGSFKVPPYVPKPGDQVVPFTRRRRLTAAHMVYSKQTAPQVVTVAEVDLFRIAKLRELNKDAYKKQGVNLTYLAFITHVIATALKENPVLNARVLDDAYVLLREINVGVAVDTKDGLVVPVIKRADTLNVRGVAMAVDELALKARENKLTPDDLAGASFSVSNPGLKGNLFGGAILSQPNVGILRIGEVKKRVVVVEHEGVDSMAIHPVMYMALSYDHRIVDGVAANNFLWRVRELLEKGDFEL